MSELNPRSPKTKRDDRLKNFGDKINDTLHIRIIEDTKMRLGRKQDVFNLPLNKATLLVKLYTFLLHWELHCDKNKLISTGLYWLYWIFNKERK